MFARESTKATKEKDKYYKQAKEALKKGNEEGARLFLELAQQKESESMQYLRLSHRLEAVSGQLKSQTNSLDLVNSLNQFTPILMQEAHNLPIEKMYKDMQGFSNAYDDLAVKGNILDDGMNKTLGEKGGYKNVDNMMNGLKADVALEMGADPQLLMPNQQQQAQQESNQANNDFYDNLKNL